MKYYIFRNSTIEHLFTSFDVSYSGYGDISDFDSNFDAYIWFYILPFRNDISALKLEVESYLSRIQLILQHINTSKPVYIFTLQDLYQNVRVDNDRFLAQSLNKFNTDICALSLQYLNVKIIDWKEFLLMFPMKEWIDWKYYFISQIQLNPRFSQSFRSWFSNKLNQIQFNRKKCLVLDLDNTLWGGILGEDGIDGIKIGGDYPGNAFLFFQQGLAELSKEGIILAVCSKNNEDDVLEAWNKNPFILLNRNYFSSYRINWKNKADNIREIAEELNIGLDSIVFIDDNPVERGAVQQLLPMVEVPDFPAQAYELPVFYKMLVNKYFRVYNLTLEDRQKTEQYTANVQRKMAQRQYADFSDYLKSLEIEIKVLSADDFNISRISQMTQKTNQFNLTTHRYSEADIRQFLMRKWEIYCLSVKDRFGDNGITGCIFLDIEKDAVRIDSFMLSCRILGKEIEREFMYYILLCLKNRGFKTILAEYKKTSKNSQVSDFYEKIGFSLIDSGDDYKKFSLSLSEINIPSSTYCKIYNFDYGRENC